MKHVVLRILDGLPVYIKDEHKNFVALLDAYYSLETSEGYALHSLHSHEDLLDIDVDGLQRSIEELDETFIPVEHRREWKMFARRFNASRGSIRSYKDFFRIVFDAPVEIENTSRFVFMTSAAKRNRWQRMVVSSSRHLPRCGVIHQPSTGVRADVVEAVRYAGSTYHEVLVKPRHGEFITGAASLINGDEEYDIELVPHAMFKVVSGHSYRVGDVVNFTGPYSQVKGVVKSIQPVVVDGVDVVDGGSGYSAGDVISMAGARGWRAEVATVVNGSITSVRVIDSGDPFAGTPNFITNGGVGAVLAVVGMQGRPAEFEWDAQPFGTGIVTADSPTGAGLQVETTPVLWYEVSEQVSFNGVLSVGTIITDSDIWQASSYRVKTPVDVEQWRPLVKKMLHPIGKNMGAVKTVKSTIPSPGAIGSVDTE